MKPGVNTSCSSTFYVIFVLLKM